MAGFTCLAAARHDVLRQAAWDVEKRGLTGAPPIRVLVGADRHDAIDLAIRYLGIGTDAIDAVETDAQGRIDPEELARRLGSSPSQPTIVCLQAGEVHTGAFDPFRPAIEAAHDAGAWVHVDGAFGLWARAGRTTRHLTDGIENADSWSTDGHKTLNVPYDNGLAVIANRSAHLAAFSARADYLMTVGDAELFDTVPELSRRARGFTMWAALRSLGRNGVADLVDRFHERARQLADGVATIPGAEVVNDVVFTQVMVRFVDDAMTDEIGRRLLADGAAAVTPAAWRGRRVQRISVSNWSTDEADVRTTVEAFRRIAEELRPATVGGPE
jgi:glutamate/tyrosine decarboxylase-like PLP-dependent enzyme